MTKRTSRCPSTLRRLCPRPPQPSPPLTSPDGGRRCWPASRGRTSSTRMTTTITWTSTDRISSRHSAGLGWTAWQAGRSTSSWWRWGGRTSAGTESSSPPSSTRSSRALASPSAPAWSSSTTCLGTTQWSDTWASSSHFLLVFPLRLWLLTSVTIDFCDYWFMWLSTSVTFD